MEKLLIDRITVHQSCDKYIKIRNIRDHSHKPKTFVASFLGDSCVDRSSQYALGNIIHRVVVTKKQKTILLKGLFVYSNFVMNVYVFPTALMLSRSTR